MTTPLAELLAKVPALNDPSEPFTYVVKKDTIIGEWNIVSAKSLYPTSFETIDKKFKVIIEFDEKKGSWKPKEKSSESGAKVSGGGISFGSSSNSFSGKSSNKGFSLTLGGAHQTKDGISPVLAYSFDSDKIKKPLFEFLEANGWKRKRGLFG